MLHGPTASAATPSTTHGGPTTIAKRRRYSSRSNSFSSASIVTVKRSGSISSTSTGARSSGLLMRPQSPGDHPLIALRVGRDPAAQEHRRRKSVAIDAAENDGSSPVNRWSHTTTSSVASIPANSRRSRTSGGAALAGAISNPTYSPSARNRSSADYSPRDSPPRNLASPKGKTPHRRRSPAPSPERRKRPVSRPDFVNSLTALPPLHTTPALTDAYGTGSFSSIPQTLATTPTYSSFTRDYFSNETSPRSTAVSKQSGMPRNTVTSMSNSGPARSPLQVSQEQQSPLRKPGMTSSQGHSSRLSTGAGEGTSHRRQQTRDEHDRDKKMMLSKALQKANTAVLLDNAQNFEGALDAYNDACRLLQQVMDRSSAPEDKQKLEAIRVTYTNRIDELVELDLNQPSAIEDKDLPARPMSNDSLTDVSSPDMKHIDESSEVPALSQQLQGTDVPALNIMQGSEQSSMYAATSEDATMASRGGFDVQRGLNSPAQYSSAESKIDSELPQHYSLRSSSHIASQAASHLSPIDPNAYMPAPLSPRKQTSAEELVPILEQPVQQEVDSTVLEQSQAPQHRRTSTTSTSWLDTIDESGSSSPSSVHSKSSKTGLRRKHLRNTSGDTDPDFDAAFDAAVEAAYDEGLEPDLEARKRRETALAHRQQDSTTTTNSEIMEVLSPIHESFPITTSAELNDAEEERFLDEITSEYAQGFNFDLSSKSIPPRQSDSSGYSRSTWQSSQASMDRTTAATSLSTVAEDGLLARLAEDVGSTPSSVNTVRRDPPLYLPPAPPPPSIDLPQLPEPGQSRLSTVRSRRLSGQNAKQLKIETSSSKAELGRKRASTFDQSPSPRHDTFDGRSQAKDDLHHVNSFGLKTSDSQPARLMRSPPSIQLRSAMSDTGLPTLAREGQWRRSLDEMGDQPPTSARPVLVRKNKSSMSLRAEHMVLLASPDVDVTPNIMTPMSSTFMTFASKRNQDPLNSQRARLPPLESGIADGTSPDGIYLFDTSLSSPQLPSSPRTSGVAPPALEPCPESFLLRPFWLMRSLTSTLTHSRGGYVTNRLFIPREVWQTKNVKLKSVDDKVANCDLLTAALGRLAGVDTFDADAVMLELQSFEEVMERVQISLAKKLGSDVGVQGVSGTFKDAPTVISPSTSSGLVSDTTTGAERTKSKESKGSYLSSWRKLRSKSSGAPLTSASAVQRTADKEMPTMSSVPMTSFVPVERRGHRRDIRGLAFDGPNKEYMGSLARLFDGAQVLDHIARQVEDPGLKHSSPTHVGLELSIRHAAEFFGFYICRFVLADISTLMDKYVKRGTEWVLA